MTELIGLAIMVSTIVLVALKLGGAIAIGWVWVLCPVWIPIALLLAVVVISDASQPTK